jgi:hypothetical protein
VELIERAEKGFEALLERSPEPFEWWFSFRNMNSPDKAPYALGCGAAYLVPLNEDLISIASNYLDKIARLEDARREDFAVWHVDRHSGDTVIVKNRGDRSFSWPKPAGAATGPTTTPEHQAASGFRFGPGIRLVEALRRDAPPAGPAGLLPVQDGTVRPG